MPGLHVIPGGCHPGSVVHAADIARLRVVDECYHHAGRAGPRRPAGAVQVILVVVRRVEMDDELDVVDVDAAGGDVGGDQDPRMARRERVERALPLVLVQVPVDGDGIDAGPAELLREPVRAVLGADEEQRAGRPAGDLSRDRHLVLRGEHEDPVLGRRRPRDLGGDGVQAGSLR